MKTTQYEQLRSEIVARLRRAYQAGDDAQLELEKSRIKSFMSDGHDLENFDRFLDDIIRDLWLDWAPS